MAKACQCRAWPNRDADSATRQGRKKANKQMSLWRALCTVAPFQQTTDEGGRTKSYATYARACTTDKPTPSTNALMGYGEMTAVLETRMLRGAGESFCERVDHRASMRSHNVWLTWCIEMDPGWRCGEG